MFYVSKITPFLFLVAIANFIASLYFKSTGMSMELFFSLVYGFVGTTLMGAMYQIVPNSQNRKLPMAPVSYLIAALFVLAQLLFYLWDVRIGAGLIGVVMISFAVHMIFSIKNWMPVTVKFLGISAISLALSGVAFALSLWTGLVPFQFAIHTLTVGAMISAIYGVELAWIPMLLMETVNIRRANKILYIKVASTFAVLVSFFFLNYVGIALSSLLELAGALYFIHTIYSLIKNRRMPAPIPYVVSLFLIALSFLPFGILMGMLVALLPEARETLLHLHIDLMVYGFGAFTIFGGMSHLFPRIMWNWKFAKAKNPIPIKELINERAFPKFMWVAVALSVVSFVLDAVGLRKLSWVAYLPIPILFANNTFLYFARKLREAKDG